MMNFQAEFDQLVSSVVTSINDVIANASNPADGYLWDANKGAPLQIFVQVSPDTGSPLDKGWITSNVEINKELVQQPGLLGFMRGDGKADYDTTEALAMLFEEQKYYLNPNTTSPTTFTGYYTDMVSQLANEGSVYKSISTTQQQTALAAENARTQIVGVSSDEELQFMIMFQNAYNASSRYINALSEMLGTLINTMGA
jgi:flagellar hook-associated protein 1 FlgK